MIEDINKVRPGVNRVVVKLNEFNKKVKFSDGTELYLETKYEPANHTQVIGEVLAVPDKLYFNKEDPEESMEWKTTVELQKGDIVYIEYLAVMLALADKWDQAASYPQPTWFEHEGDLYIIIRYADVYFAIRDKEVIPVNGYCIAKPISAGLKSDIIILSDEQKNKISDRWAELVFIGTPCTEFVDNHYRDVGELNEGDIVLFDKFANQRIEYVLHKTLFGGKGEYFVIQRKWMKLQLPNKYKSKIKEGKIK